MEQENAQTDSLTLRGGTPLNGEITVRGYKNSTPKDMVAALLTKEKSILRNVPKIRDIELMTEMLREMGAQINEIEDGVLEIDPSNVSPLPMTSVKKYMGKSRIPTLLAGPMIAGFGEALLPHPGGCTIGPRPIDFHIMAMEKMGAVIEDLEDGLRITAKKLHGAKIKLDYPSVGATEQILTAAVLADGVTEITNAAIEPDIMDRILLLQKMGAYITVDFDRTIHITGVDVLHGFDHTAMPDRNETVSWACAAAATNGRIFVRNARQIDIMTFLNKFRQAGGLFEVKEDGIVFSRGDKLKSIAVETDVHPGFMTDWQQPFVVMLTQAEGASVIHETVYEDRFGYAQALNDMGARIQVYRECLGGKSCRFGQKNHMHSAIIMGATPLHGSTVEVPDLRAGFSYVLAGLIAEGNTTLNNISLINRGYENFYDKLRALGAEIVNS